MFGKHNRLAAFIVFGLAIAGFAQGARAADYTAQKARIVTIEKAMAAAQNMTELAPYIDANMMFDDMTPGRVTGLKNFSADIAAQYANAKNLQDTILKMDVDADDRLAYAISIQHVSATTPAGQQVSLTFRQTDCYHRTGGKWLLVYQHLSVPFDPKTGKAVLDAAP